MILDEQNINNIFNKAFDGAEAMPPESVWENIEKQLDEASIDGLFKGTFENATVEPPVGIWAKIQANLWMKDFMNFTPNRINIYYTSLVAVLAGVGLFMSNNKQENPTNQNTITKNSGQIEVKSTGKSIQIKPQTSSNQNKTITREQVSIVASNSKLKSNIEPNSIQQTALPTTSGSGKIAEIPTGQKIIGDTLFCVGTERPYELSGDISNCNITWSISPKTANIDNQAKNKISITCNKAGLYIISADISNSASKKTIEYQVRAIDAAVPVIVGNTKICEGTQAQFKLGSTHYIGKMYSWDVVSNRFSNVTSAVILVDCKNPGYDTVKVRDINTKTGCNNTAMYPITIYPKPDADFKIVDNGGGIIELYNTSKCGQKSVNCKQTVKWLVNDQTFTKNNIAVEFTENGIFAAILEVQNEFNCKETAKKDITIDMQNLFVPNAFIPGSENGSFIAKGENLASYTIEIFDASNKKLWQSSQLVDGRPSEGWDGEVNDQLMPNGTYYWKISATFKDGTKWKGVNQKGRYQTFGTFVLLKK
jgi:hypothetical protein